MGNSLRIPEITIDSLRFDLYLSKLTFFLIAFE
jgi:hypothetical protein